VGRYSLGTGEGERSNILNTHAREGSDGNQEAYAWKGEAQSGTGRKKAASGKRDFPHDRGARKLTIREVIEALRQSAGIKSAVAAKLNCWRTTLYASLAETVRTYPCREVLLDAAPGKSREGFFLWANYAGTGRGPAIRHRRVIEGDTGFRALWSSMEHFAPPGFTANADHSISCLWQHARPSR
jgi:hypothetical protein